MSKEKPSQVKKHKVAIVGATGYTGVTLIELLLKHPNVQIDVLTSEQYKGQKLSNVYNEFSCSKIGAQKLVANEYRNLLNADVIFFATPNGVAHKLAPRLVSAGKKVIDLSADYRFRNLKVYEKCYGFKRGDKKDKELNRNAVYGLVELKRKEIKDRLKTSSLSLIGNPGCYTTASILALAPILDMHSKYSKKFSNSKNKAKKKNSQKEIFKSSGFCNLSSIIIDAKSGVSGAGRKASLELSFNEVNDSLKPYNLAGVHRHTPELEEFFTEFLKERGVDEKISLSFSPHLIPMTIGLLATCYIDINPALKMNDAKLKNIYTDFYGKSNQGERFVEILDRGVYPETKWTLGTNNAFINVAYDKKVNRAIITCAIDNLIKGAAGQAIQNMNLLLDLPDDTGF